MKNFCSVKDTVKKENAETDCILGENIYKPHSLQKNLYPEYIKDPQNALAVKTI